MSFMVTIDDNPKAILENFTSDNLRSCYKSNEFERIPLLISSSEESAPLVESQMRHMIRKFKVAKALHGFLAPISRVSAREFDKMKRFEETYDMLCKPSNLREANLLFSEEAKLFLGIKNKPTPTESNVLHEVSTRFWDFANQSKPDSPYLVFRSLMTAFYQGEHFVFLEDDPDGSLDAKGKASISKPSESAPLYETLSSLGKLRGSSHYDHGTLNGATGGPVPTDPKAVKNPQYGIDGPHFKHLCLGRATLLSDATKFYFGKTEEDVLKETKKPTKEFSHHRVTWLQTEGAPDSSSLFTRNFWRHRVRDFTLYIFRKNILHSEKPNVGPYGYGHGDNNPTLIDLRSSIPR
jgi:hypothetical protein